MVDEGIECFSGTKKPAGWRVFLQECEAEGFVLRAHNNLVGYQQTCRNHHKRQEMAR